MRDNRSNVTPFRRARPQRPRGGDPLKSHRGKAVIVHALTLATFAIYMFTSGPLTFLGLALGIAAVAIAASNRQEGMPWAMTHHEQALRTIVLGAAIWTLASLLTFLPALGVATPWIHIAVAIWAGLRAAIGLVMAGLRRAMPNPKGFLV